LLLPHIAYHLFRVILTPPDGRRQRQSGGLPGRGC
jgi:hypothetical protein